MMRAKAKVLRKALSALALLAIMAAPLISGQLAYAAEPETEGGDASGITLTLHASSVEGDDFVDSIEIPVEQGKTVSEALATLDPTAYGYREGYTIFPRDELFTKEGYVDYGYRVPKPMSGYSSYDDLWNNTVSGSTVINGDMDIYYTLCKKAIDEVEITVTSPICGVETTTPEHETWSGYWLWEEQTNKPAFNVPGGKKYHADDSEAASSWCDMEDDDKPFIGTFEGDEAYKAEYWLKADFGYCFADDDTDSYTGTATVNGGTLVETRYDENYLGIVATVTAEHDWDAGTVTTEPTCTEAGVKTFACKNDSTHTKTEDITALGHSWGAWTKLDDTQHQRVCANDSSHVENADHTWDAGEVTKAATATATGEKTFTCTVCKAAKTETIPTTGYAPGEDPTQEGTDGTAVGSGASAACADKAITSMTNDNDPAGSVYSKLQLKSSKQTKSSVTLAWTKGWT